MCALRPKMSLTDNRGQMECPDVPNIVRDRPLGLRVHVRVHLVFSQIVTPSVWQKKSPQKHSSEPRETGEST